MTGKITGINRDLKCAVVDHERYVWITNWIDADGDECDPEDAVFCIAGDDDVGWWSIDLSAFSRVNVN